MEFERHVNLAGRVCYGNVGQIQCFWCLKSYKDVASVLTVFY